MEDILVEGKIYNVPNEVAAMLQHKKETIAQLRKTLDMSIEKEIEFGKENLGYRLMFAKLQAGEKVSITGADQMKFAAEKMKSEWEADVKYGMAGWLQENWSKLCGIGCECGKLISYEKLRNTNELKCDNC